MIDFKSPRSATRVFVFIVFIVIGSCKFCQIRKSKSHPLKEKVLLEKAWNIVSRSGIEIKVLADPKWKHESS